VFGELAAKLARFALDDADPIRRARPSLPNALNDREQDNWEPLLAIADCADGSWPDRARAAALALSGSEMESVSPSAELLADIQAVFEMKGVAKVSTVDLLKELCEDEEKSWGTYNRGKPMTPRQLAKRLKEYKIGAKTVRIGYDTPRGFELEQFEDVFARYLAPPVTASATAPQTADSLVEAVADAEACCET
jgi:putative DNA primase/helicase